LLRRVVERVGEQCKTADQGRPQEELKPRGDAAEVLMVEVDGSMLPIRGNEPWKEAKVGVLYRHDPIANRPIPKTSRYVAVVNGLGEFAPVVEEALEVATTMLGCPTGTGAGVVRAQAALRNGARDAPRVPRRTTPALRARRTVRRSEPSEWMPRAQARVSLRRAPTGPLVARRGRARPDAPWSTAAEHAPRRSRCLGTAPTLASI
jgi:hypothetical protein